MPLSFQNVTYSEGLALEGLAEEKWFQELLEEREGDQLKHRSTWCYKHLRYTSKGLKIHGDKCATEGPSVSQTDTGFEAEGRKTEMRNRAHIFNGEFK